MGMQAYWIGLEQVDFTFLTYNIKEIERANDDAHRALPDLVPNNFTGNAS